jgi:hypothetical protein
MTRPPFVLLASVALTGAAYADVPHLFSPGQKALSAQVNQNFTYLDDRIDTAIGTLVTASYSAESDLGTSVTSVTCPANSLVLSASCECDDDGGTRNYGVLFACTVSGNGGVVGCFTDAATYDPELSAPQGQVTIRCLSGLALDGSPLFVTPGLQAKQKTAELEARRGRLERTEASRETLLRARR